MKFGLFGCCATSKFLKQYRRTIGMVLDRLGIDLVEEKGFTCCGYPFRNVNSTLYALSSARNLALAEKKGLGIVTDCSCCYSTLIYVQHLLKEDESLRQEINDTLNSEGLNFTGTTVVKHLTEIFYQNKNTLEQKMIRRLDNAKVALHYGCHLLRPRQISASEGFAPVSMLNQLIDITGALRVEWEGMAQCCGASVVGINDTLATAFVEKKLKSAMESEAGFICVICPFCQIQFETTSRKRFSPVPQYGQLPSILYVQLIGLCMGIDAGKLGVSQRLPLKG